MIAVLAVLLLSTVAFGSRKRPREDEEADWDGQKLSPLSNSSCESQPMIDGCLELQNQILRGAPMDSPDEAGMLPVHWAVLCQKPGLLILLRDHANAPDSKHRTPLHIAVSNGLNEEAAVLINECKANVNAKDADGMTPLHLAVLGQSISLAMLLVKCGASPNHLDRKGFNPLHLATILRNTPLVSLFLRERASLQVKAVGVFTPYKLAVMLGFGELELMLSPNPHFCSKCFLEVPVRTAADTASINLMDCGHCFHSRCFQLLPFDPLGKKECTRCSFLSEPGFE